MNKRGLVQLAQLAKASVPKGAQGALCLRASEKQQRGENGSSGWRKAFYAAGGSLALVGIKLSEDDKREEKIFADDIMAMDMANNIIKETKMRKNHPLDKLFDYFSSYQMIDNKGKKTNLMSVKNFFNATTPGSFIRDGYANGGSNYILIEEEDIGADWMVEQNELTEKTGFLNELNSKGLLTLLDFHFLFLLVATPPRYVETIFHAFDISADGNVEAKEFVFILAKIANLKADPEEILKTKEFSGLAKFLFGDDLKGNATKEDFVALQTKLIDNILSLEYHSCCDEGKMMTEADFCKNLLFASNMTEKKKKRLVKRVSEKYSKGKGISYENYKTFYSLLFGGADLERALFMMDTQCEGVTREEFAELAKGVGHRDIDPHVVDVVYSLLDENDDGNLSFTEFAPVIFQWRQFRGFKKDSLAVSVGFLRF